MRPKIPKNKKAITRGVSLKPDVKEFAEKSGHRSGLGFSGYLSSLVEYDRSHDLLGTIVSERMKSK
jgi:hypothetical protein